MIVGCKLYSAQHYIASEAEPLFSSSLFCRRLPSGRGHHYRRLRSAAVAFTAAVVAPAARLRTATASRLLCRPALVASSGLQWQSFFHLHFSQRKRISDDTFH